MRSFWFVACLFGPRAGRGLSNGMVMRHRPGATTLLLLVTALLAACGAAPGATGPSPAASGTLSPRATPSGGPPLFAVLETRRAGAHPWDAPDTIALAKADGYAVAKTTFAQRSAGPTVPMAAVVGPPPAVVANGAVYYLDGFGVIRRLDRSGAIREVANFPLTPDQNLSFAVSPDGSTVIAARLTFPHVEMLPSPSPSGMPFSTSGNWSLEILKAHAGGSLTILHRWEAPQNGYPDGPGSFTNIVVVGWDAGGPIANIGSAVAVQNGVVSQRFFGGYLARLDASGNPGARISPAGDCQPQSLPTAGRIVCLSSNWQTLTVQTSDGTALGTLHLYQPPAVGPLSPDGTRLAVPGQIVSVATGASVATPASFDPIVWLDEKTLIGTIEGSNPQGPPYVGKLRLQPTVTVENWHFTGTVVDVIR